MWKVPLLWVLYLGYLWIIAGLGLKAASALGYVTPMLAVHAFTTGGIGVLTLGMMARVSLGHSGRPLQQVPTTTMAFILINLAAAVRVIGPLIAPAYYISLIVISAVLWAAAFGLFLIVYTPIYLRPRLDGRPG